MWAQLRGRQLAGAKFRRQAPIGGRIADFVCLDLKLVIELDGSQHAENAADEERTRIVESDGFTIMRFWNGDVMTNLESVVEHIRQMILAIRNSGTPHPTLSPWERAKR